LLALEGEAGARDLIRAGRHVVTTPAELIDVDTPEELARLRAQVSAPETHVRHG
jgi:molybdenum cofactor cytidylyltransferase